MDCYFFIVGVGFDYLVKVVKHIVVGGGSVTDNKVCRKQLRLRKAGRKLL